MTLEELFIKIKYKYDRTGAGEARRDIDRIDKGVVDTGKSLDKLNAKFDALGVAATAAAAAGIAAYSRFNAVMVEFSGKAGMSIGNFRQFASEANRIARTTGTANEQVIEQMQRIYSLGGDKAQANRLGRAVSVLESRGVVNGAMAAESAMALQNLGLGSAMRNLQMTFAAGQTGPGVMSDYFQYSQLLSGVAGGIADLPLEEILGALTVVAAGGKMSTGASGLEEVISSLFREPEGKKSEFYTQQTGEQWGNMQSILQEGGLPAFIRHMAENFTEEDLFKLFGSKEAARSIALLMSDPSKLDANIRKMRQGADNDAIGAFEDDTNNEFSIQMKQLSENLEQLLEKFGEPFAKFFTPFLKALNGLIDGLLTLNETTGGLIGWIAAISTSLFALPRAFRFLRGAFRGIGSFASLVSGLDTLNRDGKDDKGKDEWFDKKSAGTAASSGIGGFIGATIAAALSNFRKIYAWASGGLMSLVSRMRSMMTISPMREFISRHNMRHAAKPLAWSAKTRGGIPSLGMMRAMIPMIIKGIALTATATLLRIVAPLVIPVATMLLATGLLSTIYSKLTDWDSVRPLQATRSDRQADFFRSGGKSGEEPAPGPADIAAAQRAFAEAEAAKLQEEAWALFWEKMRGILPDVAVDLSIGVIGFFDRVFQAIGMFFREFWADPRAMISLAWDKAMGNAAKFDAKMNELMIKWMGGEPSEEAKMLGRILEENDDGFKQPTISMTRENLERLGIKGDYSNLFGSFPIPGQDIGKMHLPTPTTTGNPALVGRGSSRFDDAGVPYPPPPVYNMELSMGDINISGTHADDRFELARQMREEAEAALKNSADYIIQEMESLSP